MQALKEDLGRGLTFESQDNDEAIESAPCSPPTTARARRIGRLAKYSSSAASDPGPTMMGLHALERSTGQMRRSCPPPITEELHEEEDEHNSYLGSSPLVRKSTTLTCSVEAPPLGMLAALKAPIVPTMCITSKGITAAGVSFSSAPLESYASEK